MNVSWPWFSVHALLLVFLAGLVLIAPTSLVTGICALIILFYEADFFGSRWFPHFERGSRWLFGVLTLLGVTTLFQTAWYYLDGFLSSQSDGASFITALFCLLIHQQIQRTSNTQSPEESPPLQSPSLYRATWITIGLLLAGMCTLFILSQALLHPSLEPVRTPWALMPAGTMAAYALLAVIQWLVFKKTPSSWAMVAVTTLTLVSVTCLTPLLYPLGFGFDGFLHRASEQLIATTGTLSPKPFYYIGQYTLITWIGRWLPVSLRTLDVWLVPVWALLLPLALWQTFAPRKQDGTRPHASAWGMLSIVSLLPLAPLITTTPQSFSYILGLVGVGLALSAQRDRVSFLPSLVASLWSVAVHPLAGLPFLGATCCLLWTHTPWFAAHQRMRSTILWIGALLTILSVPLALALNSLASSARISWRSSALFHLSSYLPFVHQFLIPERIHVSFWADWVSWVSYLSPLFLMGFAGYALLKDRARRTNWIVLCVLAAGCALVGVLLSIGSDFTFLISYERSSYAERLWIIAQFFLLFPALHGVSLFATSSHRKTRLTHVFLLCVFAAFQAGHIYGSFPRHDAVVTGHGWNSGISDRDAVRYIEQNAGGKSYTVLANQQVSALAIEQYGFKRYAGDVFYYPVPTGGPLYQLFLDMMQQPNMNTVHAAAKLGQSSLVYVVLNNYWWEADRVADELSQLTDHVKNFSNTRVRVYRFDVTNDKNF